MPAKLAWVGPGLHAQSYVPDTKPGRADIRALHYSHCACFLLRATYLDRQMQTLRRAGGFWPAQNRVPTAAACPVLGAMLDKHRNKEQNHKQFPDTGDICRQFCQLQSYMFRHAANDTDKEPGGERDTVYA